MLAHEMIKSEDALPDDVRTVSVVVAGMVKEGYRPLCMIAKQEGFREEDLFLAQLNIHRNPMHTWKGTARCPYKTMLVRVAEGLRAVFFISGETPLMQAYAEATLLASYMTGSGEFFWALGADNTVADFSQRVCREDEVSWNDVSHALSCRVKLAIEKDIEKGFTRDVNQYASLRVEDYQLDIPESPLS